MANKTNKSNKSNTNNVSNMNDTNATNTVKSSAYEASKSKQNYKAKANATDCHTTDCR